MADLLAALDPPISEISYTGGQGKERLFIAVRPHRHAPRRRAAAALQLSLFASLLLSAVPVMCGVNRADHSRVERAPSRGNGGGGAAALASSAAAQQTGAVAGESRRETLSLAPRLAATWRTPVGVHRLRYQGKRGGSAVLTAAGNQALSPPPPSVPPPAPLSPPSPKQWPCSARPGLCGVMHRPIRVYLIWFGPFSRAQKNILRSFIRSISDRGDPENTVPGWWDINRQYHDCKGRPVSSSVTLKGESSYPFGRRSSRRPASRRPTSGDLTSRRPSSSRPFSSRPKMMLKGFCTAFCGWHSYINMMGKRIKTSLVGNPAGRYTEAECGAVCFCGVNWHCSIAPSPLNSSQLHVSSLALSSPSLSSLFPLPILPSTPGPPCPSFSVPPTVQDCSVAELASSACALAVCPSQCPPNCAVSEVASSLAAPNRDKGMDALVSTFASPHTHTILFPTLATPFQPSPPLPPNCAAWELASSLAAPNRDKGMDALCLPNCAAWELASSLAAPNRDKGMDALVSTFAHELAEATSDPYLSTWMNEKGEENADMCSYSELAVATSDRHLSTWMNDKGEENVDMCSYRCVCLQVRFGLLWCSAVDGMIGLAEATSDPYLSTWMDE
ncbi:unnamed protein product [Closterium sp. NIES-64]|nr:unnamed protein product [Closterium sp. NIES-64]